MSTQDLEQRSSVVTRRTVLKASVLAGTSPLWIPPALSVVGLTPSMAQAASHNGCTTTYPSHAFIVFLVPTGPTKVPTYYAFKFGDGAGGALIPGSINGPKDGTFLAATPQYKGKRVVGRRSQASGAEIQIRADLLKGITAATFKNANGSGYTLTKAPSSLVGVYAFDGSFKDNIYGVHTFAPVNGQYFITKCAEK